MLVDSVLEGAAATTDDTIVAEGRRQKLGEGGSVLPELTRKTVHNHGVDFLRKHQSVLSRFYVPPASSHK